MEPNRENQAEVQKRPNYSYISITENRNLINPMDLNITNTIYIYLKILIIFIIKSTKYSKHTIYTPNYLKNQNTHIFYLKYFKLSKVS